MIPPFYKCWFDLRLNVSLPSLQPESIPNLQNTDWGKTYKSSLDHDENLKLIQEWINMFRVNFLELTWNGVFIHTG
jgi:hypothetical protein